MIRLTLDLGKREPSEYEKYVGRHRARMSGVFGVPPHLLGRPGWMWRHLMAGYHPPAFFRPRAAPLFDAVMARGKP